MSRKNFLQFLNFYPIVSTVEDCFVNHFHYYYFFLLLSIKVYISLFSIFKWITPRFVREINKKSLKLLRMLHSACFYDVCHWKDGFSLLKATRLYPVLIIWYVRWTFDSLWIPHREFRTITTETESGHFVRFTLKNVLVNKNLHWNSSLAVLH